MKKIILIFFIFSSYMANSQYLSFFDIDTTNFPKMKAKFFAFDDNWNQIYNLSQSDITIGENGINRKITNISCPEPKEPLALSSVLIIDISGSMSRHRLGPTNMEIARKAANVWVDALPSGSECAITTFNDKNFLNQDFTQDKSLLHKAINSLTTEGGTNYDEALLNPPAGGLVVSKNGKNKRVIVFLTDGLPSRYPNVSQIVNEANSQNCVIYCVTLGIKAPQTVINIAHQTGGEFFENITSQEAIEAIYRNILNLAQNNSPCTIEWESNTACLDNLITTELKIASLNLISYANYNSPNENLTQLQFNPAFVKFDNPILNEINEKKVLVSAINSDFVISNITSSNSYYTISPLSFNLKKGESIELTIRYVPLDSGYTNCKFTFETDICPINYFVTGGWMGIQPKTRTLALIKPNGGEVFVAGSDTVITWEGVSPFEQVKIEYRTDDNKPWITITDSATGLSHPITIPKTISKNYLARVTSAARTQFYCNNADALICDKFVWMGCNLDVENYRNGDPIPQVTDPKEWLELTTGAWCYYENDSTNGPIYGKLYNWYAVNDPRGLAPVGWHIPTEDEWEALITCLGGKYVAGGRLKSTGNATDGSGLWISPNLSASNISGFAGQPGGYRIANGVFMSMNDYGFWWSATEIKEREAWIYSLKYNKESADKNNHDKKNGFSIRCVRDN